MMWETAILIGLLFGGACYLILQASFVRILFGFILLSNAANLFLLAMSGVPEGKSAPIVHKADGAMVDPLPQALILTAIVIGFGVIAYMVILLYRTFLDQSTANAGDLFKPDRARPEEETS